MKKYNEKAKELYEQALSAGLGDIAEDIKKKYTINKKVAQPIKTWLKEWLSQGIFTYMLLRAKNNNNDTFPLYHTYKQYEEARKEIAERCIEDIGIENILLNSEDEAKDKYNAWKIAEWNYKALNKYVTDKLLEYGFVQVKLKDVVVKVDNIDKFAITYIPTNDEQAFNTLKLMDLFQWASNNRSHGYENMMVWMKD